MKQVMGILLAAGAGRRFGGNKLLHPLDSGELMGIAAARNLVAAVPDSLAVVRPGDRYLAERFRALGLQVVENPAADQGMGTSLAAGIGAAEDAAGWLIALGDMPWIRPQTIMSLAKRLGDGDSIVAPVYGGRRGHPVGFNGKWRSRLQALIGDQGARALLVGQGAEITPVPTTDPGVLMDVDEVKGANACRKT